MFLSTDIYLGAGRIYRLKTDDLTIHKTWTQTINQKLIAGGNLGSNFFMEIAHNGNGNIIVSQKLPLKETPNSQNTGIRPSRHPQPPSLRHRLHRPRRPSLLRHAPRVPKTPRHRNLPMATLPPPLPLHTRLSQPRQHEDLVLHALEP